MVLHVYVEAFLCTKIDVKCFDEGLSKVMRGLPRIGVEMRIEAFW